MTNGNIPEAPAYGVYISQLIRYSRACDIYLDFIDRSRLWTQKLLNQGYVAPKLQSSFLKFYGRYHNLVDRYEQTVSKMKEDLFTWCPFLILDLTSTWRVSCRKQRLLTLPEHLSLPPVFGGVHVVHLFLVFNVVSCVVLVLSLLFSGVCQ